MKASFLVFGLCLFSFHSYADSSCWPEEELLGKTATGFIQGVNYSLFQAGAGNPGQETKSEAKSVKRCEVKVYPTPDEKGGDLISCDKIQCIRGDCGGEGEFTFLPIEDIKKSFALVRMKDEKTGWMKLNPSSEIHTILSPGRVGKISPETAVLLDSPAGKLLKLSATGPVALTFKKLIQAHDEEWAEVDVNAVVSEEPPVKVGKVLGHGFFQFRDKEKKIKAVLSDLWCD